MHSDLYCVSFSRQQEKRNAAKLPEVKDPKVDELRQKLEQRRAGILISSRYVRTVSLEI